MQMTSQGNLSAIKRKWTQFKGFSEEFRVFSFFTHPYPFKFKFFVKLKHIRYSLREPRSQILVFLPIEGYRDVTFWVKSFEGSTPVYGLPT